MRTSGAKVAGSDIDILTSNAEVDADGGVDAGGGGPRLGDEKDEGEREGKETGA